MDDIIKAKPSILFVNRVYPPDHGATGRLLEDLANAFLQDGWHVSVVTTGPKSQAPFEGQGVRVHRVRAQAPRTGSKGIGRVLQTCFIWLKLLFEGLGLQSHDIVVTLSDPPMLVSAGRIIAKAKGSKHVNWIHDLYPDLLPVLGMNLPRWVYTFLLKASRKAMKSCDKVVVVGRCMAKHLIHSGMDAHLITVIPNWPDPELYQENPDYALKENKVAGAGAPMNPMSDRQGTAQDFKNHENEAQEPFKLDDTKFRILYAGNLGLAHPYATLLETAEILMNTNPEIEILFVGDHSVFAGMLAEKKKRSLENIRFLPYQPAAKLKSLMESGDVHLISMKTEAAGLVVPSKLYSALAVGRPVIFVGPEGNETAQVIRDFKTGTVVPQGDAEQLANAIRKFRYDSQVWFNAQQGSHEAGRIFTPEQSCAVWVERIRRLLR